jgi:hypothetical protein
VAGARRPLAFSEMDRRDGTLGPSETEEFLGHFSVPRAQFSEMREQKKDPVFAGELSSEH